MPVPVSFAGQTYQIPQRGETGWFALTNYLVALSQAQTRSQTTYNVRAISTTSSIQSTDTFLVATTAGGAFSVTLPPSGVSQGRLVGVVLAVGANRLTVVPDGADTVAGRTSFILDQALSAAYFFCQGINWHLISGPNTPAQVQPEVYTNPTNRSVSSSFIVPFLTTPATAVSTSQTMTMTLAGSAPYRINVGVSSNDILTVVGSFFNSTFSAIHDPNDIFLATDAGTGIFFSKSSSSAVISIKNRLSGSLTFQVVSENNAVVSATAWS